MHTNDTQLITVDCPHEGCENTHSVLVPGDAVVVSTSVENEDQSGSTGKVRTECTDHLFYVHFNE